MRVLPSDIYQKVQSAYQTLYNDADPEMELIISRQQRYIQQGTILNATTLREGEALGAYDIAARKEDANEYPSEYVMLYIEDGIAKVATIDAIADIADADKWVTIGEIGQAKDVAIEFDGHWERVTERTGIWWGKTTIYTLVTVGEPYLFRVLPDGKLVVRQGINGIDMLLAEGVTACSAIRGWKNITIPTDDAGLIVAYTKAGQVKYRAYTYQADNTTIWEQERDITTLPVSDTGNVSVFRTNDYRQGFMTDAAGKAYMTITKRNWAGMAIPAEYIGAAFGPMRVSYIKINFMDITTQEYIGASFNNYDVLYLHGGLLSVTKAYNDSMTDTFNDEYMPDGDGIRTEFTLQHEPIDNTLTVYIDGQPVSEYTISGTTLIFATAPSDGAVITATYQFINWARIIKLEMNAGVFGAAENVAHFTVKDSTDTQIVITSASVTGHEITLNTSDFNNAVGDITVEYDGQGTMTGEAGQAVNSFNVTFTPINLDPIQVPPPEVEAIWNE